MAQSGASATAHPPGAARAGDLRWAGAWGSLTLALSSVPYLLAWAFTPDGYLFSGLLVHPADGFSYLAKMRQGFDGAWLFTLPYAVDSHAPAPLFSFHLTLGHLARWTDLPLIAVYHAARLAAGVALLVAFWDVLGLLCYGRRAQELGYAVGCVAAGFGWLALPFGVLAPDLVVPEGWVFFSILANPHFPAALAALAAAVSCSLRAVDGNSQGWAVAAALSAAALAAIHPHLVLPLALVLAGLTVVEVRRSRTLRPAVQLAGVLTVAAVPAAVQAWALLNDPVLAAWTAQNRTPSPHPGVFLLGLGVPGLLAAVGGFALWKQRSSGDGRRTALAMGWLAVVLLLLYAPVAFQRRYYEGLQFPLAALAGAGAVYLFERGRASRAAAVLLLTLAAPSTLLNAALPVLGSAQHPEPLYIPQDDLAAYAWLAVNGTRQDVVLAGPVHGNQLPAYAPVRVVWGHPFETINSEARLDAVRRFFGSPDCSGAAEVIINEGVTLVYAGREERRMGGCDVMSLPGAIVVHQQGEVTLFRTAIAR